MDTYRWCRLRNCWVVKLNGDGPEQVSTWLHGVDFVGGQFRIEMMIANDIKYRGGAGIALAA